MRLRSMLFALVSTMVLAAPKAPNLDPVADFPVSFQRGFVRIESPEGAHLGSGLIEIKLQKGTPGALKTGPLPPTNAKDEFGEGIWRGLVQIPVTGQDLKGVVPLVVTYQPCTEGEGGVCFPPAEQVLKVKAAEIPVLEAPGSSKTEAKASAAPPAATASASLSTADPATPVSSVPGRRSLIWVFLGIFVAGLFASMTPCVFPMIPIILAIIGAKGAGKGRSLALTGVLVLGMAVTYTLLGVVAARAGAAFGAFAQKPVFLIPVSIVFVVFAISLFGAFEIQLPEALRSKLQGSGAKGGFLGAFLMGLVLGPISAPCVGPVIGTVLLAIAQEGKVVLGGLQLFTFALGMGVLFMVVGFSTTVLPRSGPWLEKLKHVMGLLVLAFAAWNVRLIMPGWLNLALWCLVALAAAAILEAFKAAEGFGASLRRGVALLALVIGILLGVRAVESALKLELLPRGSAVAQEASVLPWIQQDLEGALARAKTEGKLVLVDTYAEWCVQCKELDEKTWPDPAVQAWIREHAVPVRIDTDKVRPDLAKPLKIASYPTVVLLDAEGRELRRFMGFQKPEAVLGFLEGRP
jgi:thiol:disulfide interchange protein DsbD